jgi:hypothetical protein
MVKLNIGGITVDTGNLTGAQFLDQLTPSQIASFGTPPTSIGGLTGGAAMPGGTDTGTTTTATPVPVSGIEPSTTPTLKDFPVDTQGRIMITDGVQDGLVAAYIAGHKGQVPDDGWLRATFPTLSNADITALKNRTVYKDAAARQRTIAEETAREEGTDVGAEGEGQGAGLFGVVDPAVTVGGGADEITETVSGGIDISSVEGIQSAINRVLSSLLDPAQSANLESNLSIFSTLNNLLSGAVSRQQFETGTGFDQQELDRLLSLGQGGLGISQQGATTDLINVLGQLGLGGQGNQLTGQGQILDFILGTGQLNLGQGQDFTNQLLGIGGLGQQQLGTLLNSVIQAEQLRSFEQDRFLRERLAQRQNTTALQQTSIQNPFNAFALNSLFGLPQLGGAMGAETGGTAAPQEQQMQNILGFIPSLSELGFQLPQPGTGPSAGFPFTSLADIFGNIPTSGALAQNPLASSFTRSFAGAGGFSPRQQQQESASVTPLSPFLQTARPGTLVP